ncbi:hypothetical protein ElyMa_004268900 [Elysia marginata]|uniref:Uncharacterized protein n=1 Tax=Elysia marginata TaxID=1093978 RepID=A0AAV4GXH1_9GAST|nr:hypothetical protein ElyMa_004268900 [Elysia marginata]
MRRLTNRMPVSGGHVMVCRGQGSVPGKGIKPAPWPAALQFRRQQGSVNTQASHVCSPHYLEPWVFWLTGSGCCHGVRNFTQLDSCLLRYLPRFSRLGYQLTWKVRKPLRRHCQGQEQW